MIRLILVEGSDGANNNKFYHMEDNGDGTFKANWGRVGANGQFKDFPMRDWDKKLHEKLKKGYVDITEMSSIGTTSNGVDAGKAQPIVDFLMNSANESISDNYLVGADAVTQAQVDEAQKILNSIGDLFKDGKSFTNHNIDTVNHGLKMLYTTIPRKMGKVKDHMADSKEEAQEILTLEQANLDVMAGQVVIPSSSSDDSKGLGSFGIDIQPIPDSELIHVQSNLNYLKGNFKRAWKVSNSKTERLFEDNLKTASAKNHILLWHGSRNENWWSILRQGLLLKPTNAVITGKMWGQGLYFADYDRKSYGYTSGRGSYWSNGKSNSAILALYDVHLGRQAHYRQHEHYHSSLDWEKLQKIGAYDSVFAEKGVSLVNNEFIVYKQEQCTVKYLVEVSS